MRTTLIQTHGEQGGSSLLKAARDAISESLGLLGESQRAAITFLLKRDYQVDVENPGTDLERVFSALRSIFGGGAPYLIEPSTRKLSSRLSTSPIS